MLTEGCQVAYIGLPCATAQTNAIGELLSLSGSNGHVMWATGSRCGRVDLVPTDDLIEFNGMKIASVHSDLAESFDAPGLSALAVRETFDSGGEVELLNALNKEGHLVGLSQIAEDALEFVARRIHTDSRLNAVLGDLESEERESVLSLMASVLLRDAFGETDDA